MKINEHLWILERAIVITSPWCPYHRKHKNKEKINKREKHTHTKQKQNKLK